MPDLSIFKSPAPYHIITYGTLLGTQVFQSFIGGVAAFKALPRPMFSQLQEKIFPIYFGTLYFGSERRTFRHSFLQPSCLVLVLLASSIGPMLTPGAWIVQTALPAVLALTYPGSLLLGTPSSIQGTIAEVNRWTVLVPLGTMFLSGLVNMLYVGPETTRIMKERKHQETRDGKKSYDAGPHSTEMEKLNRSFGKMHGISSLINLGALISTVWYGFTLAARIT